MASSPENLGVSPPPRQPPTITSVPQLAASENVSQIRVSTSSLDDESSSAVESGLRANPAPIENTTSAATTSAATASRALAQLAQLRESLNGMRKLDVEVLEKAFDELVKANTELAGGSDVSGGRSGVKVYYHEVMIVTLLQELEYDISDTMMGKLRCFVAAIKFKIDLKLQTILLGLGWSNNETDNARFTQPSKLFITCISGCLKNEGKHWSDINFVSTANGTDYKVPRICIGVFQEDRGYKVVYLTDYENRGINALRGDWDFLTHSRIFRRGANEIGIYDRREQTTHIITRGSFVPLRNGSLVRLDMYPIEYKQPVFPLDDEVMQDSFESLTEDIENVTRLQMKMARSECQNRNIKREGKTVWPAHPARDRFEAGNLLIERLVDDLPPLSGPTSDRSPTASTTSEGSPTSSATSAIPYIAMDDGAFAEVMSSKRPSTEMEGLLQPHVAKKFQFGDDEFDGDANDGQHCGITGDLNAASVTENKSASSASNLNGTALGTITEMDEKSEPTTKSDATAGGQRGTDGVAVTNASEEPSLSADTPTSVDEEDDFEDCAEDGGAN